MLQKEASIQELQKHLSNAYKQLSRLGLGLEAIQDSGLEASYSHTSSCSDDERDEQKDNTNKIPQIKINSNDETSDDSKELRQAQDDRKLSVASELLGNSNNSQVKCINCNQETLL